MRRRRPLLRGARGGGSGSGSAIAIAMIAAPQRSPRRRELPWRSVCLSSIPDGTLTPLKELLKAQGVRRAGPAAAENRVAGPAAGGMSRPRWPASSEGAEERPDVSDVLAGFGLDPAAVQRPKRRACEPPASECPAKIFQRMKAGAAQPKRGPGQPAGAAPPRSRDTDPILTPGARPAEQRRRPREAAPAGGRQEPAGAEAPAGGTRTEIGWFGCRGGNAARPRPPARCDPSSRQFGHGPRGVRRKRPAHAGSRGREREGFPRVAGPGLHVGGGILKCCICL